ncbi:hydroquinone glucosyltransferase-like [Diospyros lotus]|uniref:hydroquinone glucosyltransferase-like n=1 Tax=Diospyros lotus TaxID=55363 RepID=UPI00224CEE38|nr:hydroquinone glucosyltransferase-like [Diospyros lotus]
MHYHRELSLHQTEMGATQQQPPHVAVIPSPGIGHLIPLTEFAKRLVHRHFSVTLLVPTDGSSTAAQKSVIDSLPKSVNSILLPPVSFADFPNGVDTEVRISLSVTRSLPAVRDSLRALPEPTRLSAFVVDIFGTDAFDLAGEFGVPAYVFFPTTAMALSFLFYLPELDERFDCEYRDLPGPVELPGCIPVHGKDLCTPVQNRKSGAYKWNLSLCRSIKLAAGIIVNSFLELEPGAFKALKEHWIGVPPIYPIGPLIQTGSTSGADGSESLKWLDRQPPGSVLFVSFGSGGTLSHRQLTELAMGLELSGQRFLWVIKSPHEEAANANFFSVQSMKNPFSFLPEGFLDRTRDLGLVVPSWAPQAQILSHGSTGGFLSHCGWNSTLESIVHGVPIVAWPLYAEQMMNAALLCEDLKVGYRVKAGENGVVGREAIAGYVKGLIEGDEGGKLLRDRMRDLKDAAEKALSRDGSSWKSFEEVAQIWRNHRRA